MLMTYLDVMCLSCGPFRHSGSLKLDRCPQCGGFQVIATPHDYVSETRFKNERRNRFSELSPTKSMLARMDL